MSTDLEHTHNPKPNIRTVISYEYKGVIEKSLPLFQKGMDESTTLLALLTQRNAYEIEWDFYHNDRYTIPPVLYTEIDYRECIYFIAPNAFGLCSAEAFHVVELPRSKGQKRAYVYACKGMPGIRYFNPDVVDAVATLEELVSGMNYGHGTLSTAAVTPVGHPIQGLNFRGRVPRGSSKQRGTGETNWYSILHPAIKGYC
ncbi:MAG: hypothetical protein QY318_00595 [Candidatus Dojkabacteria bacterium]|nr:MAG: hypothetical protein QY318_00595 [Candidatus Dojkabacteria bacterium]